MILNGISYLKLWFPLDLLTPEEYKYLIFYSGVITSLGFAILGLIIAYNPEYYNQFLYLNQIFLLIHQG